MLEPGQRPIHAVVDVGSKSIRLLVARQLSPVAFEVVDEERFDSRLGEGQRDGQLSLEAIERGCRALRIVTQVANSYGPDRIVAVGTEALRQAPNAATFTDRVFDETGVRIRIIEAPDEAFGSFLGVVNSTSLRDGCVVDIGGGSLELMRVEDRQLTGVTSVPLGAIYATERFLRSDPPSAREVRALRRAVRDLIPATGPAGTLYGAGGALRNLARMARLRRGYPVRRLHGYTISRSDLRRLSRSLSRNDLAARRRLPGVNADRVATLPAAAIVIEEVMDILEVTGLVISGQGMREGLLWQELRGEQAVLPDVRSASVAGLAAANGVDVANAEPEATVAARLFHATEPLHGLGPDELDLLVHAAGLAEIGMHVDFYNRDRHAEYLVHSGDLHGFTHREIVLLAATVRWSSSGTPDLSPYQGLVVDGDERRVVILGALLGVARAVWRRTPSPVGQVDARLTGDHLEVIVRSSGPADAEEHALERQVRRLEAALKLTVDLTVRWPR